ncbi:Xaa-Pro peptidase family protein [Sporichthya sp.]|uniref:M24 family metallopeptidase n=1 Tax=Sporichthya sp. TaxID=65475 RepID=UPI00183092F2|nr:Xaa-Pro peptidase family protein [Sporichthya sp.]MBA3742534.1 aminopeptidase P family protein [Sporichthya sp.]
MPEIHEARRERLRASIQAADVDAALITDLVNVRYLTGFTGSNAALLVTSDTALLATDGRYVAQAGAQAPDVELEVERACAVALSGRADKLKVRRLGFESHHVTVDLHGQLAGQAELVPLGPAVEELRTVKDEVEISALREAAAIADAALAEILEGLVMGRTERHVARELERRMLDKGAEAAAFDTIVAAGENSAIPHHRPTDRRIAYGDLLKIDFGARVAGYHSDMTRTFVVGAEPAPWQVELYDLVFAAQRAGREALRPGVELTAVDGAARSVVEAAGHGLNFSHGLGHGVGLQIHEAPLIAATSTGRLRALTPVTIEPGVYLDGVGGIRIEDTLVVREPSDGGPELLTVTTKELLVLD